MRLPAPGADGLEKAEVGMARRKREEKLKKAREPERTVLTALRKDPRNIFLEEIANLETGELEEAGKKTIPSLNLEKRRMTHCSMGISARSPTRWISMQPRSVKNTAGFGGSRNPSGL